MSRLLALGPVLLVLVLGACVADESGRPPARPAPSSPAPTASPEPTLVDTEAAVDRSTRTAAQETLDEAFDRLVDDATGAFASYVNFGGSAIKVEGRFDLDDQELVSLTRFSPPSIEERAHGARSRVIGREVYAGPDFGPFRKCWFHYPGGSLEEIVPGDLPFDEDLAAVPIGLVLVADARAIGSLEEDAFDIRAKVSAQTALSALSSKLLQTVAAQLPEKDPTVEATVSIVNGRYGGVTVRAEDVVDAYDRRGIDLFEDDESLGESFRRGVLYVSFHDYGSDVTVEPPPLDAVVEVAGPDDVDASGTTCSAAQG